MKKSIALLLLLALLTGCGEAQTFRANKTVYAMDTVMTLVAYGPNTPMSGDQSYSAPEYALIQAEKELVRLDDLLSVSKESSDIYTLNRNHSAQISPETAALLRSALDIAAMTDGDFDPTVSPLMELWGFRTQNYHIPSQAELDKILPAVDFTQITLDGETASLPANSGIDLGGIAKGYASERALAVIAESGAESAIISLGGNVGALGLKPGGVRWNVAIQDPANSDGLLATLALGEADSMVYAITSGGYQRYFRQDNTVYHHILDPKTGAPAETDLLSVTIVSSSGTLADGLSTALFVKGFQDAVDFWRTHHEQFEMVLVTEDRLYATQGLSITSEQPITTLEVAP